MDLNKLTDISAWDVRNVYNKVKNVVMNYSEMEVKVNEATSSDPWGASSTLMRELADATHNRKDFDDIMPMIYVKINDMDPSNWRQVYKALQLVEYLVKNGSGRVVDDVRGHLTIIKTLKSFHHIDGNGKDQGINVRHRSKELVDLVNDNERLREERKKAKENRNKYSGFSGGARMDGFGSSSLGSAGSSRYGGLGSSRYGGLSSSDFVASRYDDRSDSTSNYRSESSTPSASSKLASRKSTRPEPSRPAEPEVADLFSFDDADSGTPAASTKPVVSSPAAADIMDSLAIPAPAASSKPATDLLSAPAANSKPATDLLSAPPASSKPATDLLSAPANNNDDDDDEWGDFQGIGPGSTAPVLGSTPVLAQVQPTHVAPKANSSSAAMDLLGSDTGLNLQPMAAASSASQPLAAAKPADAKKGAFSDIWDVNSDILSLDSLSLKSESKKPQKSLNQLANQL